jgi:hypothetical protein
VGNGADYRKKHYCQKDGAPDDVSSGGVEPGRETKQQIDAESENQGRPESEKNPLYRLMSESLDSVKQRFHHFAPYWFGLE